MSNPLVSRGIDIYGSKEFPWTAACQYVDPDICATLLKIICFPYTPVICFSTTCQGIYTKFYCISPQGDLRFQQKSTFSLVMVVLHYKKEICDCITAQTLGASALLHTENLGGNISTSSPWPSIKFWLTVFQWRHKGCPACNLSPGKLRLDFCCLILSV